MPHSDQASRAAVGSLTILAGKRERGKSLWVYALAAALSHRSEDEGGPLTSLLLVGEDPWESVAVPRLKAAEADLDRVRLGQVEDGKGSQGRPPVGATCASPTSSRSCASCSATRAPSSWSSTPWRRTVRTNMPAWGDQMVQQVLIPLQEMAEDEQVAIVIVTHPSKRAGTGDLLSQIKGAGSITDTARSVLWLARDPLDPKGKEGSQRVLMPIKRSLDHEVRPRRYKIVSVHVPGYGKRQARLEFVEETDIRESDLSGPGPAPTKRLEAEAFLRGLLASGPVPATAAKQTAMQAGITEATLNNTKAKLHIHSDEDGYEGGWLWRLPASDDGRDGDGNASEDPLVPPKTA